MFRPRLYSIIVVTFDAIARVDLLSGKSVQVVHTSRVDRPEHAELADAVTAGVSLGSKKLGRLYVLSNEFWSGQVSLSNEIVEAVSEDQLEQTLALEAEYESGIPPFESRLGYTLVASGNESRTWWVTQAESTQLEAMMAAATKSTAPIAGIASTKIDHSFTEGFAEENLDTTSSEGCAAMALAWLARYLVNERDLPIIHMTSQSWTEQQQRRRNVVATVGILVICAAFHANGTRHLDRVNTELVRLVHQEQQLRETHDKNEKLARLADEARLQRETIDKAQAQQLADGRHRQEAHTAIRRRPVRLLRALAATADTGHWIQGIDLNGVRAVISGVAIDNTSITTLAQGLEWELDSSKWLVKPAVISVAESTPLVRFEMTLVPRGDIRPTTAVASHGVTDAL